jgi:hypothetical protein
MKSNPDHCPICGKFMDVLCSGYRDHPFVDGRCHEYICHICHSAPCTWRFDEDVWMWKELENELHTVEELVSAGFDKKEVITSLKALKLAIKKKKPPK